MKQPPRQFRPVLDRPEFPMFRDAARNAELAEKGYVIFPFLDPKAVSALKAVYHAHHAAVPERFYASTHAADSSFRKKMDQEIKRAISEPLSRELVEHQALGGAFISKPAGKTGLLPPHADWNIVDESKFRSYNLWIPLVDTTRENGAVQVLPYSHAWLDHFRGPGIPNIFQGIMPEIWAHLEPLEMKAGTALLYDHRLVHASDLNQGSEQRLACVFGVIPPQAELRLYCQEGENIVSYRSAVSFHLEHNPEAAAEVLEKLEEAPAHFPEISLEELHAFLEKWMPGQRKEKDLLAGAEKRNFWKVYTPGNILREFKYRISQFFQRNR